MQMGLACVVVGVASSVFACATSNGHSVTPKDAPQRALTQPCAVVASAGPEAPDSPLVGKSLVEEVDRLVLYWARKPDPKSRAFRAAVSIYRQAHRAESLSRMRQAAPDRRWKQLTNLYLARSYGLNGQRERAVALLEAQTKGFPADDDPLTLKLAESWVYAGNAEKGRALARPIWERAGKDHHGKKLRRIDVALVSAAFHLGEMAWVRTLEKRFPIDVSERLLGLLAVGFPDTMEAEIAREPKYEGLNRTLTAQWLWAAGRHELAKRNLKRAFEVREPPLWLLMRRLPKLLGTFGPKRVQEAIPGIRYEEWKPHLLLQVAREFHLTGQKSELRTALDQGAERALGWTRAPLSDVSRRGILWEQFAAFYGAIGVDDMCVRFADKLAGVGLVAQAAGAYAACGALGAKQAEEMFAAARKKAKRRNTKRDAVRFRLARAYLRLGRVAEADAVLRAREEQYADEVVHVVADALVFRRPVPLSLIQGALKGAINQDSRRKELRALTPMATRSCNLVLGLQLASLFDHPHEFARALAEFSAALPRKAIVTPRLAYVLKTLESTSSPETAP